MAEPSFLPSPPPPMEEHVKKQAMDPELFGRISKNVNSLAANLRILEERYANLRNRLQNSEQNIISLDRDIRGDIKLLSDEMIDLKRDVSDIKDKLRLIGGEIKNLANKNDFKVVERYIDMWQPMNFVTKNELKKMLEEKAQQSKIAEKKQETS